MAEAFKDPKVDVAPAPRSIFSAPRFSRFSRKLVSFGFREEGAIAVEFALFFPILALAVLFLGFLGGAVKRHMDIEQILRAGIEVAVRDPGQSEVLSRMRTTAATKGYTLWTGTGQIAKDRLHLEAYRTCVCADSGVASCDTICTGARPTSLRYTVWARYSSSYDERMRAVIATFRGAVPRTNDVVFSKVVDIR